MKKILLKLVTLISILALTLSFAGCAFFQSRPNDNGSINDLPSSTEALDLVEVGKINGDRVVKDKTQVIAEVRSAVVAIAVANDGSTSYGSGVIVDLRRVDEDGELLDGANDFYVMTCHHVIDGLGDITVYLPDAELDNFGESDYDENYAFTGKIGSNMYPDKAVTLVGGDSKSDIALLKLDISGSGIDASTIKKVAFPTDSYQMMVGEDVIAIGNPSGKAPGTVTVGTISYINRETTISEVGDMTLTQINVDIYHGSSGGALFNLYGELIGITNGGSDTYSGMNYAIPYVIDKANGTSDFGFINIASHLLATKTQNNYGYVDGRIGLFGFTTTQETLQDNSTQVRITEVTANSLAYEAGLTANDVITKIVKGDKAALSSASNVTTNAEVTAVVRSLKAGDTLSIQIKRQGNLQPITISIPTKQYIFCDTGNYT